MATYADSPIIGYNFSGQVILNVEGEVVARRSLFNSRGYNVGKDRKPLRQTSVAVHSLALFALTPSFRARVGRAKRERSSRAVTEPLTGLIDEYLLDFGI